MDWTKKVILLTGGTGSFGKKFVELMLKRHRPKAIRIFSRDELKQWEMDKAFCGERRLRFFIGDIRDKNRLERAMDGADIIVHAAALKQVPICEYNPIEAVKTNILGAQNIIEAAIDHDVERVMAISSDKAVNPANLYGASKLCMEKLFIAANAYVGSKRRTMMSCIRYGNVVGSRGSVIPLFKKQALRRELTITDERMTRFWITLEQGADFVIRCTERMRGGEVFVPKIPSMTVTDLAKAIAPGCRMKRVGIRPGEKLHETLVTEDEARHTKEFDDYFVIKPDHPWRRARMWSTGKSLPSGFSYTSDDNDRWLTSQEIRSLAKNVE